LTVNAALVHVLERRGGEEQVQLEILDESVGADQLDGGVPAGGSLTHAHQIDQFIWMFHELLRTSHHLPQPRTHNHRHNAQHEHAGAHRIDLPTFRFEFVVCARVGADVGLVQGLHVVDEDVLSLVEQPH